MLGVIVQKEGLVVLVGKESIHIRGFFKFEREGNGGSRSVIRLEC